MSTRRLGWLGAALVVVGLALINVGSAVGGVGGYGPGAMMGPGGMMPHTVIAADQFDVHPRLPSLAA